MEIRPASGWRIWASLHAYRFEDRRVEASIQAIEGNWVRRVPEHQATAQVELRCGPLAARRRCRLRYQGERYEDELNGVVIDDAWIADLRLTSPIGDGLDLTARRSRTCSTRRSRLGRTTTSARSGAAYDPGRRALALSGRRGRSAMKIHGQELWADVVASPEALADPKRLLAALRDGAAALVCHRALRAPSALRAERPHRDRGDRRIAPARLDLRGARTRWR